jgi:hypothetical protein
MNCEKCGNLLDDNNICGECMTDPVKSPIHYNQGAVECIDALCSMTKTMDGTSAYLSGNVVKYIWRHQHKNGMEDLEKAQVYLDWLKEHYRTIHK